MLLVSKVSGLVADPLARAYRESIARDEFPCARFGLWELLPQIIKKWLGYRVFSEGYALGQERLLRHPVLSSVSRYINPEWSLSPAMLLYLWQMLRRNRPRCIVEFGPGASTHVFAAYVKEMAKEGERVAVYSIEHNSEFVRELDLALSNAQLGGCINLIHAPITKQALMGRYISAYGLPKDFLAEQDRGAVDLCLIDGPPRFIGRLGCLPLIAPHLCDKAIVVLDDGFRRGEQEIARRWAAEYPLEYRKPQLLVTDGNGAVVAKWRKRERQFTKGT